ncbi:hypothetical protein EDC94DRAFT_695976 [Helicostylum pulchrum]|nr:hypothetical protein EDC94DRAFT_695976 [Helicostylum pulchrum]
MLRRKPTSVTLTTMDIELFKDIVREQQLKRAEETQVPSPEIDVDRDRLKEKEEEEDEDIEEPLFKKTRF